jgi:hypothetical protein
LFFDLPANGLRPRTSPAGCGAGTDVDSAWEQKKLEATLREMLAVGATRRDAAVPTVQCIIPVIVRDALLGAFIAISVCVNFGNCQELELYWIELR